MRRLTASALFLLALVAWAAGAPSAGEPPPLAAAYLLQVQGRTVWAEHAERRLLPASLTKIMTALLVLEADRPDEIVTVSRQAAGERGARLGLAAGDRMRVRDLLTATVVRSANDACHALAEWRAGSQARFVQLMNRRAKALGLGNTRFANACGLDAPRHYTSAADLAALTRVALGFPAFKALVRETAVRVETADGRREFLLTSTNALLGRMPGAIGVKTGFTRGAGPCVVALAEREGVEVLLVLLNARNRWWDADRILEYGFSLADKR